MSFNQKRGLFSRRLLFCCFNDGNGAAYPEAASSECDDGNRHESARSPCSCIRSAVQELPLPEIRDKCRGLIARIGRCERQAPVAAPELGYDRMNYALNFEDDQCRELDKESPTRNFLARLPVSPDRLLPGKLPRRKP